MALKGHAFRRAVRDTLLLLLRVLPPRPGREHAQLRRRRSSGTAQAVPFQIIGPGLKPLFYSIHVRRTKVRRFHPGRFHQLRQPEVEYLHHSLAGEKDICRLDVAMNNSLLMRSLQALAHLHPNVQQFRERQRSLVPG